MSSLPVFTHDGGQSIDYPLAQGLKSRRLALGCMQFAGSWEPGAAIPEAARKRARGALQTALELGWDFYDPADIYCRCRSEVLFGELIRELKVPRESIIVQSKCGIRFPDDPAKGAPHRYDFSREHIIWSAEASLQRLGMDYLDIFLFHRPDFLAQPQEMLEAMATLRDAGKVRHFGVSNCTPPLLDLFEAAGFVPVANQVELNLLRSSLIDGSMVATADRKPEAGHPADGTLEWHRRKGVVTQAWAPMAYGYLCGRAPDWEPERVGPAAECVQRIAADHGVSPEAVVIGWLLQHPATIQPIIGSQDPARLKGCHEALSLKLSREEWYTLFLAGRGRPLP